VEADDAPAVAGDDQEVEATGPAQDVLIA
jgi:hypothetical protein